MSRIIIKSKYFSSVTQFDKLNGNIIAMKLKVGITVRSIIIHFQYLLLFNSLNI